MHAEILSRHSAKWAQHNNSIIVRGVDFGNWTTLRMGFLWSVAQDVLSDIDPDFAFGFCSGTGSVYGDNTATHFVGATSEPNAFGNPWPLGVDNFLSAVIRPTKQIVATKTNGTNLTTGMKVYANTAVDNKRSLMFLEMTRDPLNLATPYSFKLFYRSAGGSTNPTSTDLANQIASALPALTDHAFSAAQTLAVNETTNGALNAVQIFWSLSTSRAEVDEIAVARIA